MTKKLYYEDSFLKEFNADIISFKEKEGQYHIKLDRTAFYPEGGGQPADRGLIGRSKVRYVYKEKGEVYHVIDQMPAQKEGVDCEINWKRRFELMQQHSGQHLLSAVLENAYQAGTIGFHLSENNVTIDIDRELADKDFELVEERVNQIIYQDRKIIDEYPEPEELKTMELRKEPAVEESVRVVRIKGIDLSPCGGTHLHSTGQIGIVSLIDTENHKEGMRITFLCGIRALEDYKFKNQIVARARESLSVKNEDINSEIERLKDNLEDKESQIKDLKDELLDYRVDNLREQSEEIAGYHIIKKIYTGEDFSDVRYTADKLVEYENNIVIFGQKEGNTVRMILAKSENINILNMNDLIGKIMGMLDGNGGGHEYFAQGGGSVSSTDQLAEAVEKAVHKVENAL
ncbi:MAG: alanyl-tRNA editing protein, partial [bacterium]